MESLIGWVFGLAFLFLGMAAILLPWINRSRIVQLENQISRLQKLLSEKEKIAKESPQTAYVRSWEPPSTKQGTGRTKQSDFSWQEALDNSIKHD